MRTMRNKRGSLMGFAVLDDRSGRIEASLFADVFEKAQHKLAEDAIVVMEGDVQQDEFSGSAKLKVNKVYTVDEARRRFFGVVVVDFQEGPAPADLATRMKDALEPHRLPDVGCPVSLWYRGTQARAQIALGQNWAVTASDELLRILRKEFAHCTVSVQYRSGATTDFTSSSVPSAAGAISVNTVPATSAPPNTLGAPNALSG